MSSIRHFFCLFLLFAVACGQDPVDPAPEMQKYDGKAVKKAIKDGLDWLGYYQCADGSWSLDDYERRSTGKGRRGKCDGFGLKDYNIGGTSLAVLAFVQAGHDHMKPGPWRVTLRRAVSWLRKQQDRQGNFGKGEGNAMYNQALATYALAELWLVSGDHRLKVPVRRGVDVILAARNKGYAWRYANYTLHPELVKEHMAEGGAINDTSVSSWAAFGLISAREGGLAVPQKAFDGLKSWLDKVYHEEEGGATYGYTKKRGFVKGRKFGTTALGIVLEREVFKKDPAKALATLGQEQPSWSGARDMYYWYAGTRGLRGLTTDAADTWRANVVKALLAGRNEAPGKSLHGSWNPHGTSWGDEYGGRVYTTAIAVLTLASL